MHYGHLGTNKKCPDYQGVLIFQVILYEKVPGPFGTLTKCVDYECTVATGMFGNYLRCIYTLHVSTESCHWDM